MVNRSFPTRGSLRWDVHSPELDNTANAAADPPFPGGMMICRSTALWRNTTATALPGAARLAVVLRALGGGGNVVFTWTGTALQSADAVNGPYADVAGRQPTQRSCGEWAE
jgi:hypothetical protein